MTPDFDPYQVLGVAPSATADQIKAAFRRRSSECHPAKPGGRHEDMLAVMTAWALLTGLGGRAAYDDVRDNPADVSKWARWQRLLEVARARAEHEEKSWDAWDRFAAWLDSAAPGPRGFLARRRSLAAAARAAQARTAMIRCPGCGNSIAPTTKNCPACGHAVDPARSAPSRPRSSEAGDGGNGRAAVMAVILLGVVVAGLVNGKSCSDIGRDALSAVTRHDFRRDNSSDPSGTVGGGSSDPAEVAKRLNEVVGRIPKDSNDLTRGLPVIRSVTQPVSTTQPTDGGAGVAGGQGLAATGPRQSVPSPSASADAGDDPVRTYERVRTAAGGGDAHAMCLLALMYFEGRGITRDVTQAVAWFRKAADAGDADAMFDLGQLYQEGRVVSHDDQQAAILFQKAAAAGNPQAMHNLAVAYNDGRGVAKDPAEAVAWTQRAAAAGVPQAMYNLGNKYLSGQGVAQSDTEALRWFRLAAEKGNLAAAMNNLGVMYQTGRGVAQDDAAAAAWYLKAAQGGYATGMYNYGAMCANGQGVVKDDAAALAWLRKAAAAGEPRAQQELRDRGLSW